MKTIKNLMLAAICLIATSAMTSCLNSDDDSIDPTLTEEEQTAYLTRLCGTYTGEMTYTCTDPTELGKEVKTYSNTIKNMRWVVNSDKTITIYDFPDSIYNNSIIYNEELRHKVKDNAPAKDLKCEYATYRYNDNGTIKYAFQLLPKKEVENPQFAYTKSAFTVDGTDYAMQFGYVLYYGNAQSFGLIEQKTGELQFQLILADIQCTPKPEKQFKTMPNGIVFKGHRM